MRSLAPGDPNDSKVLRARYEAYCLAWSRDGRGELLGYDEWVQGYEDYQVGLLDGDGFVD